MLTATAKLISVRQTMGYLNLRDPLFEFMTNRQLLSSAATLEFVVVILLLWVKSSGKKLALIAWIGSVFFLYRISIYLVKLPGYIPCPCLGDAAASLHISPNHLDWAMKAILAYLLVGSYGLLLANYLHDRNIGRPNLK